MQRIWVVIVLLYFVGIVSGQALPFIEGEVDDDTPYIGETINYTLRIYTTEELENSTIIEPSFFGFGRAGESEPISYAETVGTTAYTVIEQDYRLYPLRAGTITIDPFRIDIGETPFRDALTIVSDAVDITVQDYPEPRPVTFINGVGQFDISASASPTNLASGDALTLDVTVSGSGNVEQLLAPIIPLPEGWRLFDAETSFEQNNQQFGTKRFTWTVIVNDVGTIDLPAIEFSFLDPQTGSYATRTTAPISLTIAEGNPAPEITIERTQIVLTPIPIPDLRPAEASTTLLPPTLPIWFWFLWVIPPILAFIIWLSSRPKGRSRQQTVKPPRKQSGKRPIQNLQSALKALQHDNPKEAYQKITDAIYGYLSVKSGEVIDGGNYQDVLATYPANYQSELADCLEEARQGQYAPVNSEDVRHLSQRVLRVCVAIEKATR